MSNVLHCWKPGDGRWGGGGYHSIHSKLLLLLTCCWMIHLGWGLKGGGILTATVLNSCDSWNINDARRRHCSCYSPKTACHWPSSCTTPLSMGEHCGYSAAWTSQKAMNRKAPRRKNLKYPFLAVFIIPPMLFLCLLLFFYSFIVVVLLLSFFACVFMCVFLYCLVMFVVFIWSQHYFWLFSIVLNAVVLVILSSSEFRQSVGEYRGSKICVLNLCCLVFLSVLMFLKLNVCVTVCDLFDIFVMLSTVSKARLTDYSLRLSDCPERRL